MFLRLAQSWQLLAIGDYRRMWAIGGLAGGARWLEMVAVAIYIFELTGSPQLVALLAVLRMLPYALLGVVTGALADAFDRRGLLIGGVVIMAILTAGLGVMSLMGTLPVAWVGFSAVASGVFWTLDMPVRRRLMVDAASSHDIAAALSLDNATMYATRALGPIAAGATYQLLGIAGVFLLTAAIYLICLGQALAVTRAVTPADSSAQALPLMSRLIPPWRLLRDRRFIVVMGVTAVFNIWCFPLITMVPVIAQKDFGMTPAMVGALAALEGVGGTLGALIIGTIATQRTLFRFYYWGVTAFLVLALVLSTHLTVPFAVVMLLAMGGAAAGFSATQYALVHVSVPAETRGRAAGLLSIFIGTSIIGFTIAGELFARLGSVGAMRVMGIAGLAMMALLGAAWMAGRGPEARTT